MSKWSWNSAALALVTLAGCGPTSRRPPIEIFSDMDRQPKYKAQMAGAFFPDGRASRQPVPGTVAQGQLKEDVAWSTGISDGMYIGKNPLPITREVLARGEERYNIYCATCHDRTGQGHGIVSVRSSWLPSNLHDPRQKNMTDGELFWVATNGRRSMPAYRFQVDERDRWAIVAYVRALQRTTSATLNDVPAELKGDLR
jgi:cytochrome c5